MKLNNVNFDTSYADCKLIHQIAKRAAEKAVNLGVKYPLIDAEMDITACHANGNPLKLKELLNADDANFGHDVFGIRRYIDRGTGQLLGLFVPRFSA